LVVEILLDDPQASLVRKEVVVRSVSGHLLGVEFVSTDHYDKLGPYLLYRLT
jgi:hypothetical protein